MKRSQHRLAAYAVALAGALINGLASAQGVTAESTHLELLAPIGCSSTDDFTARVARRSSRIRFVAEPARRSIIVKLARIGSGLRGSVTLVEADGATRTRKLTAKTCEEAAEGLALIATVTLDPDALLAEPEPESEPEPKPEKLPATKPPPARQALRTAQPSPQSSPKNQSGSLRLSVGLAATVMVQLAPVVVPGGSLEVALERNSGQVLAPFFRLSVLHAQRREIQRRGGRANFAYTLPTLDVCPVRLGSRILAVRPCAFGSVGMLEVWGSGGALRSETHRRVFASAGGALWGGLRVSEMLEIIADVRAIAPLRRDSFAFDEVAFWTTPSLGFSSIVGVAGGFP